MENWSGRVISVPITDGNGITVLGAVLLKPLHFPNLSHLVINSESLAPQPVLKSIQK